MMDDDYDMEDISSPSSQAPVPVAAPLPTEVVHDGSSSLIVAIWGEHPKTGEVVSYLARWPPSRTPGAYAAWIAVERGPRSNSEITQDLAGLARDWEALKQRAAALAVEPGAVRPNIEEGGALQCSAGNPIVTVDVLDALALAHGVLSGKWLIYAEPHKIDDLWSRIVTAVIANAPAGVGARAKVSPARPGEPHVVCVYVEDYSNAAEVDRVREALRRVGVRWKIGFKPDIYTHLGIYKTNEWKIRPSRYLA
ncbi:UPF0696 protein C11orf68 [Termitomyces sp. J132]|nr:hypothetical protein C0989_003883 [Termitomyces sp. Mn162]KAH0579328.1 hypothetical protein H2248_003466 [Termitomyces sp. 'cryptogamus']KNZ76482.1 UPF0696 protein C11orf68 [Termitomyces sp. J132]